MTAFGAVQGPFEARHIRQIGQLSSRWQPSDVLSKVPPKGIQIIRAHWVLIEIAVRKRTKATLSNQLIANGIHVLKRLGAAGLIGGSIDGELFRSA